MWHCDVCNLDLEPTSKSKHLLSFRHIYAKNSQKEDTFADTNFEIPPKKILQPRITQEPTQITQTPTQLENVIKLLVIK
jgi:hypothetical protein